MHHAFISGLIIGLVWDLAPESHAAIFTLSAFTLCFLLGCAVVSRARANQTTPRDAKRAMTWQEANTHAAPLTGRMRQG